MKKLLLLLLPVWLCCAASLPLGTELAFYDDIHSLGGGMGGQFAFINDAVGADATKATATFDGTGAALIVVHTGVQDGRAAVADDQHNTWIAATPIGDGSGHKTNQEFYCISPTVNSSMTVTNKGTDATLIVEWFSCTGTPIFVAQSPGAGTGTLQPGSLDPSGATNLFTCSITWPGGGGFAIDSDFFSPFAVNGANHSLLASWKISDTAENPTWATGDETATANSMMEFGVSGGGGGGGTFALVDHAIGGDNSVNQVSVTLSTTGAKLIVVSLSYGLRDLGTETGPTNNSVSDLFIAGSTSGAGGTSFGTNQLYYLINPTQSGTYTITCQRDYLTMAVESFSYSGTTPTFDGESAGGSSGSFTTIQPGTQTPSATELFVTGIASWGVADPPGQTATINSSFNKTDQLLETSTGAFGSMAWKNSGSAENPTWTSSQTAQGGSRMMMFK